MMLCKRWKIGFAILLISMLASICTPEMVELTSYNELKELFSVETVEGPVLSKALLLGIYSLQCIEAVNTATFIASNRHAPKDFLTVARIDRGLIPVEAHAFIPDGKCSALLMFKKGSGMDVYSTCLEPEEKAQTLWIKDVMLYEVTFFNSFNQNIRISEHHDWGETSRGVLAAGETSSRVFANLGELYTVRNIEGEFLTWFGVDSPGELVLKPDPDDHQCIDFDDSSFSNKGCNKEDLFLEYATLQLAEHVEKQGSFQFNLLPQLTSTGFEKHQLPRATFKWIKSYYGGMKTTKRKEGLSSVLNQREVPTFMLKLTRLQKKRLDREIMPLLSAWSNQTDLELTSIYGIREYNNGSTIKMHVDRCNTHVISAIINVDQSSGAIWPLQIVDHDGTIHEISMEPGSIVFYESARLLHGRENPLQGDSYANCFIHYKPSFGWEFDWV